MVVSLKNAVLTGILGLFATSAPAAVLWNGGDRPSTAYHPVDSPYGTSGGSYTEGGTGFGAIFSDDDPSPGFMRQLEPGVAGGSSNFSLDSAGTHLNRAAGWTVEIKHQIASSGGDFAMYASMWDNVGGVFVLFEPTQVEVWKGNFSSMAFAHPITSGFHSYYFSMAPGGTNLELYLDGILVNSALADVRDSASERFAFGDGTSSANAGGIWDYVYVNGPAVPEPAGLSLITLAAIGAGVRRWSR